MLYGTGAGVMVSIAPLITDLPIMGLAVLVVSNSGETSLVLGVLAICGAVFLACLAYGSLTVTPHLAGNTPARSLRTGVIANLLNPHPYLFWLTVGAPILVSAQSSGYVSVLAFLTSMYICLIVSKMLVALIASRGTNLLTTRVYVLAIRILGIVLVLLAVQLFWKGFQYFSGSFDSVG